MGVLTGLEEKSERWRSLVEEQRGSGRSVRVFCEEHGLRRGTFCYWQSKCREQDRLSLQAVKMLGRFIPLSGKTFFSSKFPRIHLPNGVWIDLGEDLGSGSVNQLTQELCGVGHPPKDACPPAVRRGHRAKS